MKNSFCRICRGRFNLKYPPAAVDSLIKKSITTPRTISVRISESGEVSENICWDCEETLLGFHKIGGDEEEELVVVDDDEILYKSLEKSKRNHLLSKERKTEIIQIDSSDSDEAEVDEVQEECVIIPSDDEEDTIIVETARRTVSGGAGGQSQSQKQLSGGVKKKSANKKTTKKMSIEQEDTIPRGRIFECKQCPLCPYHSGIEYEVVYHIRQTHPQYNGDDFRFDTQEGDSLLTRRITVAHLWTFFECKECGKIYDRFWPHRKHITTHDRKKLKNALTVNNNKITSPIINLPKQQTKSTKNLKRPLDEINGSNKSVRVKMIKTSNNHHTTKTEVQKTLVVKLHKSEPKTIVARSKQQSQSEKTKNKAILRKQQQLQARRDKRRQKKEEEKKAALKANKKAASKPTFKMPTQPAPRASSVVKQIVQKLSFTCKLCSVILPSFLAWNSHMIRDHSSAEFEEQKKNSAENICRLCDKHFNNGSILEKHIRFSHRRKNRKVDKEVNGNDKDEICCQSQAFKKDESKDDQQLEQEQKQLPIESLLSIASSNESNPTAIEDSHPFVLTKSALFCQYCGSLFESDQTIMEAHESSHITDGDVKRFFISQPKSVG
ncbi:uncharacterized protein LOC129909226 [Episyrphus balteatus]|uniref:uncharacterized protein LOC129909226 n=1 Tax=Episyrphus balteatus TaxID=286459 RepID=UPI002486C50E|nr:uncharacterized protein LOC129909226 [Episyrphus balteatus]